MGRAGVRVVRLSDRGIGWVAVEQTMIFGHIFVVFRQCAGEEVAALCVGHEIEVIRRRRREGGANGRFAGIADGARGKARVRVGVLRRIVAQILKRQRWLKQVCPLERVDYRGIALQQHAPVQPIGLDPGDQGAFVGFLRFGFHQRCQRNHRR